MADWQIIDSDDFSHTPRLEHTPRQRSPWRWAGLVGLIVVVLGTIAGLALREQLNQRRAAIRADLAAFIFEEETQQFLADDKQMARLIAADTPQSWQQAYRQTFQDAPQPGSTQLEEFEFDGTCALARVSVNGSRQARYYCVQTAGWKRAAVPPSVWSGEQMELEIVDQVRLYFKPQDQAFAENLARDLQRFFVELEQWAFRPGSVDPGTSGPVFSMDIIIEPQDLHAPLIAAGAQRIVINSPLLTPPDGPLSGEAAVRLALAQALLNRFGPFEPLSDNKLPGSRRFLLAAHRVVAGRLMLTPDSQADLVDFWRKQLGEQWTSPFFAESIYPDSPSLPHKVDVAAQLTANYIYQSAGPATLATIIYQLPLSDSWDGLFQATVGQPTMALEAQAAASAGINTSTDQFAEIPLPLAGTLQQANVARTGGHSLYLNLPNQKEPLLVEMPADVSLSTPGGIDVPGGCVPPGSEIRVNGEWLEFRRRLRAKQVIIQNLASFTIEPAPVDTVAYLIEGELPYSQNNQIFPGTKSYLVAGNLPQTQAMLALRRDGTLHQLANLTPEQQLWPLPVTDEQGPHFLVIQTLANCERRWFSHYRPRQGIVGQWLAPPAPVQWAWRADKQDILFVKQTDDLVGHDVFETEQPMMTNLLGQIRGSLTVLGWNSTAEQLVVASSWFGETYIGLYDMQAGQIVPLVRPRFQPLRSRTLSPNGHWLVHLAGVKNFFGPPDRVDLLTMLDDSEARLVQLGDNEGLADPTWSLYVDNHSLALLSGPVRQDDTLDPSQIIVASPDVPGDHSIVVQAAEGEQLSAPVFCGDGSLLYRTEQAGHYHLKRQTPGLRAKTLLTLDFPFKPLAC